MAMRFPPPSADADDARTRRSRRLGLALLLVVAVVGACTAEIDPSHGRAPDLTVDDVDPGASGGSGGVSSVRKEPTFECPVDERKDGEFCEVPGSTCEYGASANKQCNTILTCFGASFPEWRLRASQACAWEAQCPKAQIRDLEGNPCELGDPDGGLPPTPVTAADELVCNVADGVCACTTGPSGDGPRRWSCVFPSAECPTSRPLVGTRCTGSRWCDYGSCTFKQGLLMTCENGRWAAGGKTCP